MSRFANLADKPKSKSEPQAVTDDRATPPLKSPHNSRAGRKAIAAYFSPEMSLAMHVCARKHGLSLQELMAEAFDDVLRKYGDSPIGG
jgi:hypothetical protein